jgi:hypothetical protein
MNPFQVWIRPWGSGARMRVESMANATLLLDRLSRSFVFKGSEPVNEEECFPCCTFRVPCNSQMSYTRFKKLLDGIPEVAMMMDPAAEVAVAR